MVTGKIELKKVTEYLFEIPRKDRMLVPAWVFIDERMASSTETQESLIQLKNVACLPGVKKCAIGMPDIHYGYGFPIGGVAATSISDGVISPGGVGYDINCGVRAILTNFTLENFKKHLEEVLTEIYRTVPAGVGSTGVINLSRKEHRRVVEKGAEWAVEKGYGDEEDLIYCENNGCLTGADFSDISNEARERGKDQLGTLGAGNHFLEISYVARIFNPGVAEVFGIFQNQIIVMFHTGSRGFGYQICDDYLRKLREKRLFELPDPQLVSIYLGDPLGKAYFSAMKGAANYAWANRQIITHMIRDSFRNVFKLPPSEMGMRVLYDVSHNIARIEEHDFNGRKEKVCVHRKGATRSFPSGSPDLPPEYGGVGQPVLIPGDMGRSSYILRGLERSLTMSFGTTCHGAGRALSRRQAVKRAKSRDIAEELEKKGILVLSVSKKTLKEEMPEAYKDVDRIVKIVEENGLAGRVAKLVPIGVMKG